MEWKQVPTKITDVNLAESVKINYPDRSVYNALSSPFIPLYRNLDNEFAALQRSNQLSYLLMQFSRQSGKDIQTVRYAYEQLRKSKSYAKNEDSDSSYWTTDLADVVRALAVFLKDTYQGPFFRNRPGGQPPGG